jgi:hypothetical protein
VFAAADAADLLRSRGDLTSAVSVLRVHVDADRYANYLADQHDRAEQGGGDLGEIFTTWVPTLTDKLADLLRAQGDVGELGRLADAGHAHSEVLLADLLVERDRTDEALDLLRRGGGTSFVDLLARVGHLDELRSLADDGNWHAAERLVTVLREQNRLGELDGEVNAGTLGAARAAGRRW